MKKSTTRAAPAKAKKGAAKRAIANAKSGGKQGWGLADALAASAGILHSQDAGRKVKPLLRQLAAGDKAARREASDILRRLSETEMGLKFLAPSAQVLMDAAAGAQAEGAKEDWRTRGHLMLVAARVAQTDAQRRRCAQLLLAAMTDRRGVLRANALEGLGLLARQMPGIRRQATPVLEEAQRSGTAAERVRARDALTALELG